MAKHSADFRFCYLGRMGRDEVCIFKVFDSQDDVAKSENSSLFFILYTCNFANALISSHKESSTAPSGPNSPSLTQNHEKALKLDCWFCLTPSRLTATSSRGYIRSNARRDYGDPCQHKTDGLPQKKI
jgi:hypothetical protein